MNEAASATILRLRPATLEDAQHLFDWRNDDSTRQHFKTTSAVAWADHIAWLTKTMSGRVPGRELRIAETADGQHVGVVRSDETEDGFHELSYTIAPTWRGKGIGKQMVLQFVREVLPGKRIIATIEKGHAPSERIAAALGLAPVREIPPADRADGIIFVEWR